VARTIRHQHGPGLMAIVVPALEALPCELSAMPIPGARN
jgi:hypothetical protein